MRHALGPLQPHTVARQPTAPTAHGPRRPRELGTPIRPRRSTRRTRRALRRDPARDEQQFVDRRARRIARIDASRSPVAREHAPRPARTSTRPSGVSSTKWSRVVATRADRLPHPRARPRAHRAPPRAPVAQRRERAAPAAASASSTRRRVRTGGVNARCDARGRPRSSGTVRGRPSRRRFARRATTVSRGRRGPVNAQVHRPRPASRRHPVEARLPGSVRARFAHRGFERARADTVLDRASSRAAAAAPCGGRRPRSTRGPRAQVGGLADVEHVARAVAEEVDARRARQPRR